MILKRIGLMISIILMHHKKHHYLLHSLLFVMIIMVKLKESFLKNKLRHLIKLGYGHKNKSMHIRNGILIFMVISQTEKLVLVKVVKSGQIRLTSYNNLRKMLLNSQRPWVDLIGLMKL